MVDPIGFEPLKNTPTARARQKPANESGSTERRRSAGCRSRRARARTLRAEFGHQSGHQADPPAAPHGEGGGGFDTKCPHSTSQTSELLNRLSHMLHDDVECLLVNTTIVV